MIRLASLSDLKNIKRLTEACAVALKDRGIFQWNENYPSREKLQNDIEKQEMHVWEENNQIRGIIVLTSDMNEVYSSVDWLTPTRNNLYVHRLATHPDFWGNGYGQELMNFAESFARNNGYCSVRLDTFSQNQRNQEFYKKRGYQRLGNIYFPLKSEHPFFCYELVL